MSDAPFGCAVPDRRTPAPPIRRNRSEELQVALGLPGGDVRLVGLPLLGLVVDVGLVERVAEDLAREAVGAELVDGLAEGAWQQGDALLGDLGVGVAVHVLGARI